MTLWLVLAAATSLAWLLVGLALFRTGLSLSSLAEEPADLPAWPLVSVIVPARNEGHAVEPALRSLLAQDYPALEVVAVDDRSTDDTREILDAIGAQDDRLRVVHVDSLPEGWLGKNHACQAGAQDVRGDWLLFTDADVHFAPDALRRAVSAAVHRGLAHLVVAPRLVAPGFWERAFVCTFVLFACLKFRLWQLARPGTSGYVGVGAFNLVRRDAYQAIGGHTRLAFEVVDDVKLGLLLRRSGFAQGALDGAGLVRVRWHSGLIASLHGLVKNSFAAIEYRWDTLLAGIPVLCLLAVGPAWLLWAPHPALRVLGAAIGLGSMAAHGALCRRAASGHGGEGVLLPLGILGLAGVLLWSGTSAIWHRSIVWRGTRYPLHELRLRCVRESAWAASRAPGWPRSSQSA